MKDILHAANRPVLAQFALANVLLAFDYDGTLAPVVSDPARARMRARTRRLLAAVARRYPCIVISGRAVGDVAKRVGRVPLSHLFGNHGVEPSPDAAHVAATVRAWMPDLRARLQGQPQVVIEDKTYSVAVHYRRARDKRAARRAIADAVRDLPDVRVLGGDNAVNLIVRGAADKGAALQHARRAFACEAAIYVGNDATDEDAFASAPRDQLLGIRIGAIRRSRARYFLRSQSDIDRLLDLLVKLRTSTGRPVRRPLR